VALFDLLSGDCLLHAQEMTRLHKSKRLPSIGFDCIPQQFDNFFVVRHASPGELAGELPPTSPGSKSVANWQTHFFSCLKPYLL
jgi:hypothetical protein